MNCFSLVNALPGFLFEEVPTPEPSIERDNGEITEWKTVLEKIMAELKKKPQLMEMLESFDDDIPFLGCLLANSTVKTMIGEYVAKCKKQMEVGTAGKKNSTTATSIRLLGNQHFVKKEYRAAFKLYTRGLMFAKDEDDETPLLYANRSAVYFYLKQYGNALEDIERALKFGYSNLKPTGKLLIRKGFSLLALGRDDQVKELLDANMPASEDGPDFAQWQQLKNQSENVNRKITKRNITMSQFQNLSTISSALTTGEVFHPHDRFPWLNAKIDLLYDAKKGYSLVTKEELKHGEIVALGKPFISLDPKRDSYERCHYCMVPCFETPKYFSNEKAELSLDCLRMVTPLACSECSNVLYCSEACRTAAWMAYHRFECSQMTLLAKMDSESHLALRMLYRMGTLDVESANLKMASELTEIEDHLALMVNQEAYSFVYLNRHTECADRTVEKTLQMVLTGCYHLKLLQMSSLLPEPSKARHANGYLHQATIAGGLLLYHLSQVEVNESVPFTEPVTGRTTTPNPFLFVDGMTAILKHSCEATVASSFLLTESFGSTVKLLYATGGVSAGTVLTLAYDTAEQPNLEKIFIPKVELIFRYSLKCTCTRCAREVRDCLDSKLGVYYPIGCSLCGELMVRTGSKEEQEGDPSSVLDEPYRCFSTDGCSFTYSAQQMKNVYERVEAMMTVKKQLTIDGQMIIQPIRAIESKVAKLKIAIEETSSLLYRPSLFLAQLYGQLADCYLLLTVTVPPAANQLPANVPPEAKYVYSPHLPSTLLYTGKALDILQDRNLVPCVTNCPVVTRLIGKLLPVVQFALSYCTSQENEQRLGELVDSLVSAKDRYESLLKMTAFDVMVTSFLGDQE